MKYGTTNIELRITYSFNDEGDADLETLSLGDRELPRALATRLLDWMGARTQTEQVDECWENVQSAGKQRVA